MALSQDLISQFAKIANPEKKEDNGATVKGTYKNINGIEYVQLDGSDLLTPVETAVECETGERVQVLIKNHMATVTGNITSPAARSKSVSDLKDEVDEFGNTIQQMDNTIVQQGNSIIQMKNNINQQRNVINQHDNLINQQGDQIVSINNTIIQQGNSIEANNNAIIAQGNQIDSMNNTITEHGNNITSINNTIQQHGNTITQVSNTIEQQGNTIIQQGNTIQQINDTIQSQNNTILSHDNLITQYGNVISQQNNNIEQLDTNIKTNSADIRVLNSAFVIEDGVITGLTGAIIEYIKTRDLNASYAKIDFSNIEIAAISRLFTESGIIENLVVQEGQITGELAGVTIHGDLIEGNTIKAEKIVVRGEDGLYYKLNIDGLNNISTSDTSKFELLNSKPDDWETNYKDYYVINNNRYVHVDGNDAPTFSSNTYYKLSATYQSALDGTNIVAHSITAEKVAVTDLVAFGATIGGFDISNNSIHTHTKASINSDAPGLYLGSDGQTYLGDSNNHLKYYKDRQGNWKLDVKANEIMMTSSGKTIEESLEEIKEQTTCLLQIESSKGTVFKNDQVSTLLSVTIYKGADRITDMATLRSKIGNSVYLQWKWKRLNDEDYGIISISDPRIGQDGFTFTLSPEDVDTKVTFLCELITP